MSKSKFYFLIEDNNENHSLMKEAFNFIQNRKHYAEWIDFECLRSKKLSSVDLTYRIVIENFDDNNSAYKYFCDNQLHLISPLVILYCSKQASSIQSQPFTNIPMRSWPIFSQCMRGLEISSSQISPKKVRDIKNKIEMMSGKYCQSLYTTTSFLVTDSILSEKSFIAIENKVTLMNIKWIDSCWNKYQHEYRRANEPDIISEFRLPIFYELKIVISGGSNKERENIKNIVEANGGYYCGSLALKPIPKNIILLVNAPNGEKYKYARKSNIPCLNTQWIHDSLENGHILPFGPYEIDTETSNIDSDDVDEDNYDDKNEIDHQTKISNHDDEFIDNDDHEVIIPKEIDGIVSESNDLETDDDEINDPAMNTIIDDFYVDNEKNWQIIPSMPTIMFSGFKIDEKLKLKDQCLKKLSNIVVVKDDEIVTEELTHLILFEPHGTERVYSSIAAGAFLLKPEYIKECLDNNKLLNEKYYQWGNEIDDYRIGTAGPKLLKASIAWKEYLSQKSKKSIFNGFKFLILNFDIKNYCSSFLKTCTNILLAGGAKILHYDEYEFKNNDDQQINYAIIEWPDETKFPINEQKYKSLLKHFYQSRKLISDIIIYQYILEGPEANFDDLIEKYDLNITDLIN